MHWIDVKFQELEEADKQLGASSSKAAREANNLQAVSLKAWDNLAAAIRADIDQYNAHPKAKRKAGIRVMPHPKLLEIFWDGETRVLLHVSPTPGKPTFTYSLLALGPRPAQRYSGQIAASSANDFTVTGDRHHSHIDAAALSEALLSPVLFP